MKRYGFLCYSALFGLVFFADRISKSLALSSLAMPIRLHSWVQLELVYNSGISWGMLHTANNMFFTILCLLIGTIIIGLGWYTYTRWREHKTVVAEVCVLAGALSNMIDRFLYPGVIDFIHISIGQWHWPVFNIADCAITLGVLAMIIEHYQES